MATQRWPVAWLLTDERMGEALGDAMARAAAAGAGILVRHHRSTQAERRLLAKKAQALGAPLALARTTDMARELGALFVHNPEGFTSDMPFSLSVHDEEEATHAAASGAALVFVSPIHATRSHPGSLPLGEERALALLGLAGCPGVALGGMNEDRGAALMRRGFHGWAAIDAWLRT